MDVPLPLFLGSWALMMAAMMLPSAAPMILLHRRQVAGPLRLQSEMRNIVFVAMYLLVWSATGVAVWIGGRLADAFMPMDARGPAVAGVLLLAGVYQFTSLKTACLRVCRSPLDFLLTHWHPGLRGELRLGLEHGLYCLGCCWGLMVVFVAAGAMGLLWAAVIAVAVFVEKVLPHGLGLARAIGAVLIAGAVLVAVRPEMTQPLLGGM